MNNRFVWPGQSRKANLTQELSRDKGQETLTWAQKLQRAPWRSKLKECGYVEFSIHQLRVRCRTIRDDFEAVKSNYGQENGYDRAVERQIEAHLKQVEPLLSEQDVDFLELSNMLDLADRYMVWLYPESFLPARITKTLLEFERVKPEDPEGLKVKLEGYRAELLDLGKPSKVTTYATYKDPASMSMRKDIDLAQSLCNEELLKNQINNGLQIQRLERLHWYARVILFILMLTFPLFAKAEPAYIGTPLSNITGSYLSYINAFLIKIQSPDLSMTLLEDAFNAKLLQCYIDALVICGMGALGGFLSGFQQVQGSKVDLNQFEENRLKLRLKLLLGAIAALVLYTFLKWKVIDITSLNPTDSLGVYLLVAILIGFSERFIFQFLEFKGADLPGLSGSTVAVGSKTINATGDTR